MKISLVIIFSILFLIIFFYLFKSLIKNIFLTKEFSDVHYINSFSILNIVSFTLAIVSLFFTIRKELIEEIDQFFKENGSTSLVIFLCIIFIMLLFINQKEDKINSLEKELSSETKQLWKSITDLRKFYTEKIEEKQLNIFLNTHPYIISIQKYKYSFEKRATELKLILKGENTFVRSEEDLNLISQAYFQFKLNDLNRLISAAKKAQISNSTHNSNDDEISPLLNLYTDFFQILNSKNPSDYLNEDAILFEITEIMRPLVENVLKAEIQIPLSDDRIKKLKQKKSGLQIAGFLLKNYLDIYINDIHTFEYTGNSDDKKNRLYSNVQIITKNNEKFVYVITYDPDEYWEDEAKISILKENTTAFVNLLKNDINFEN